MASSKTCCCIDACWLVENELIEPEAASGVGELFEGAGSCPGLQRPKRKQRAAELRGIASASIPRVVEPPQPARLERLETRGLIVEGESRRTCRHVCKPRSVQICGAPPLR